MITLSKMKVKVNIYFRKDIHVRKCNCFAMSMLLATPARVRIARSPQLDLTTNRDYAYPVDEEYLKKYSQNQERDESTNPTAPEDIRAKEKIADVNTGLIKSEDMDLPENRYLAYPVDDDFFKKLNVNESNDKAESVNSEHKNSAMDSYPAYPVDDAILGQFVSKEVIGEPRKSQDLLKLGVLATPIEKLEKNNYKQAEEEIESQDKELSRNKYPVYPIDDEILGQFDKSEDAKGLEKPGDIPKYLHTTNPTELSKLSNPASPIHHGILKTPNQPESKAYDLPQLINAAYRSEQLEDISTITDESSKSANIGLNTYHTYPVDDEILEKVGPDASNSIVESSKSENLTQLTIGTLPNEQLEKNYTNVDVGKKSSNSGDKDLSTRYPIYPVDEEILKDRDPDSKAKLSKSKDSSQPMSPTHPIRLLEEVNSEKADDKTETSKSVDLNLPARFPAYPVDGEIVKTFGLEEIDNKTVSNNSEVLQHNTTSAIGPLEDIDDAKLNGKVESSKLENQNVGSSDIPFLELYPHYKKTFEDLGFNKPSHEIQGPVADGKEESIKSQDMEFSARTPVYPVEDEILENRGLEESANATESIKLEELPTLIRSYPSESLEEDKASGESDSSQSEKKLNPTSDGLFNVSIINKPIKAGHSLLAVRVSDSSTEADFGNSITVPQLSQFSSTQLPSSQAPDIKVSVQSGIGDSILIKIDGLRDTLLKLVGEVIAKLDLSQVSKSEEAQTRPIGDDKDRNFDRIETESTKSKKLTTFIPVYPVELSEENVGKQTKDESKSSKSNTSQVNQVEQTPLIIDVRLENFERNETHNENESTKSINLTTLIPVYPVESENSEENVKQTEDELKSSNSNASEVKHVEQSPKIVDEKQGNFDRNETENKNKSAKSKVTTAIPVYPTESSGESDGEIKSRAESVKDVKQVGIAKNGQEIQLGTWSFYIPSVRSFFKTVIHNEVVRNVSVTVATECYNKHGQKFSEILRTARIDLINCNGKRIVEEFDKHVEEINSFLPKVKGMIWNFFECDSQTCVDIGVDKLSIAKDAYQEVLKSKKEQFVKIYESEDDDVRDCSYQVHRKFLYYIYQTEFLIRVCFGRKFRSFKLLESSTTHVLNATKSAEGEIGKMVELTGRGFQDIFYSTINMVFSMFYWIAESNI